MDEYDIAQAYMAFGGIPYYLDQFRRGMSVPQNFDALLYGRQAPLRDEIRHSLNGEFAQIAQSVTDQLNDGGIQQTVSVIWA